MYIPFIKFRKLFYIFSGFLVVMSLLSIGIFGLNLGIDFKGGSSLEITFKTTPPSFFKIRSALKEIGVEQVVLQKSGDNSIILKMKNLSEKEHQQILEKLKTLGEIKEGSESFRSIGPVIGRELKQKTKVVVVLSLLAILFYIAFSFRRVSRPVKSYVYGLTSLIALFHDVLIPLGVFAVLGKFYGVEVSIPVVTAFLTVFGYSINDSVVVFDRVRENLLKSPTPSFDLTVEKSLNQTLVRSLNTSLTTLFVLFSIFLFGGETLKYFALSLILGISFGTYSSIFLATPLLVSYLKWKEKRK